MLLSVLKSLISATVSIFYFTPSLFPSFPFYVFLRFFLSLKSLLSSRSSLPASLFSPSLYAFRGTPRGYLGRAQCMLTSAPFFYSSSFLGQPLLTHLLHLLSFITHNYPLFILVSPRCRSCCFYLSFPRAALFTRPELCSAFWSLASEANPTTPFVPLYLASLSVASKLSHTELLNRAQLNSNVLKAFTFPPHRLHTCVCVSLCLCASVWLAFQAEHTAALHCTNFFLLPFHFFFFFLLVSHIHPIPTVHLLSLSLTGREQLPFTE